MNAQSILSEFSLGVTTIGAHHVVASATGVMMFCDCYFSCQLVTV